MNNDTPADKGLLNGACNRTACLARPATWFNSSTLAHYCPSCAARINAWCPHGQNICAPVLVKPPSGCEKP
jgi:hypothetical protein